MDSNSLSITWLGQGSFLFEVNGTRLLVDPFLSDIVEQREGLKRLMAPPLQIKELQPDYIFITHNHLDHFDPIALPEIHKKYPTVPIYGPQSVMEKAQEMGFDRLVMHSVSIGKTYVLGCFLLAITPAYHSDPFAVGGVINTARTQIYLSADTTFSDTLVQEVKTLAKGEIDVVLVCINGRLGNMNWQEAISLVDSLKPRMAIPMHYGMFAENTEDPIPFVKECKRRGTDSFELVPGIEKII
ncbi:MBL fold metallo-hydrolase [uncultured Maribacter sp.]|uniref:MBL fold metallo-hydrolase n=1 Tax=uncultured Maribacter sp. TaxID=431308 RepID=UPI0030EEFD5C|tara:strand:- start:8576 stop:9301 length:726 start_codon:yes stop_codon:yes gene_type:complete